MSRTYHSKTERRSAKVPREGGRRVAARTRLARGDFDDLDVVMPNRVIRRPVIG